MQPLIYLAQSDTTAGFLSKDFHRLNSIKGREISQNVLLTTASLKDLKSLTRIPNLHKNRVRRSQKTTFIYRVPNNIAVRVVASGMHHEFLSFLGALYSSSANFHKQKFNLEFALKKSDVVVLDERGIEEKEASKIFLIHNKKIKKIRG
ncbi:Sua5/YciO/YrdC/YwlC family protein [Helicobacter burdigaliensis]|uniref:Sua5/YciO/YrdC/YwlC family protein n=1 Tax=Helicobacter burdigaliensis TaxID=2315334 RepID=UPI000EF66DB4|nr:Sua5/YciO/YrdC/YwlC family protein [Helicobacter burdigaliensis]